MGKLMDFKKKTKYFMESIYFGILISITTLITFMFDNPTLGYYIFGVIALSMIIVGADFRNIIPLLFLYFGCWNNNNLNIPSVEFYILVTLLSLDGILFIVRICLK